MKLDPAQRAEARQIATELARLARSGDVLPGTITERRTRCGKPSCACPHDPPRLHHRIFATPIFRPEGSNA